MGGLDKNNGCKIKQNKTTIKQIWGESSLYNLMFMSVNQQTGFMRADLTGLAYIYVLPSYKGRKLNSPALLLWEELTEVLYVPGIGQRLSFKGPSQLGESLWSPSWFSTRLRTRSPTLSSLLCTNRWW
jgi:hypothetical protein